MNVKYLLISIRLFAIIGLLSFGASAQISARNDLSSERWILTEINGRTIYDSKAFLEIDQNENRFGGNAGCNRMFGEARISGRKISFSRPGTTKMFCSDEGLMKLEKDFTAALERSTRFGRSGRTLKIYARNRLVLKFKAAEKNGPADSAGAVKLEDRKWILETIRGQKLPKIESAPFIVFNLSEKSAGGDTGCNAFGGNYETEGTKISITNIISTMRACIEDERMTVEREFKNNLEKADRYRIAKGELHLFEGQTLLLTFRGENK